MNPLLAGAFVAWWCIPPALFIHAIEQTAAAWWGYDPEAE